jgi:hypothetical protein
MVLTSLWWHLGATVGYMSPSRIVLLVLGILALLIGGVWVVQGIGVLPGSFMTGQGFWAVMGVVTAVAGLFLVALARRR